MQQRCIMTRFCRSALLPVLALSMGCAPDPCLSQCELCVGACTEKDIAEFPAFEGASQVLVDRVSAFNCDGRFPYAAAGECADGQVFLTEFGEYVSESRCLSCCDDVSCSERVSRIIAGPAASFSSVRFRRIGRRRCERRTERSPAPGRRPKSRKAAPPWSTRLHGG